MRKTCYNVFLVVETICNLKLLAVVSFFMCVASTVCAYNADMAEKLGAHLIRADSPLRTVLYVVLVVSLLATTFKMLINETNKGIGVGFIKALLPGAIGFVELVFLNDLVDFLISKFSVTDSYSSLLVYYLVAFWAVLIVSIVKSVIGSNAGFNEITQLTGSNDVALKYFDGILSDVDFEACDIIALRYEGEENNE